uniref:Uncharacterized protein LOC117362761 n=1 Tax=Geotrypetes seraphini TaxID=260995 RepID=A0A6P8RKM9_GEOSA|nr:uncharacterized protein LOC117362761 [Geotrypetes seraphini]XP_033805567.1 uncharacterized protein LOC117362761 [Geotrypetes seraphini]
MSAPPGQRIVKPENITCENMELEAGSLVTFAVAFVVPSPSIATFQPQLTEGNFQMESDQLNQKVKGYIRDARVQASSAANRSLVQEPGQQNLSADSLDLTNFLERSDNELPATATLPVQFAIDSDREWMLKMFFKFKDIPFMTKTVRMYPDVSRLTQKRRKQFLILRPRVLQLGATFVLRYPCKCVMVYQGNRHVYFEPQQLIKFISAKEQT